MTYRHQAILLTLLAAVIGPVLLVAGIAALLGFGDAHWSAAPIGAIVTAGSWRAVRKWS